MNSKTMISERTFHGQENHISLEKKRASPHEIHISLEKRGFAPPYDEIVLFPHHRNTCFVGLSLGFRVCGFGFRV